MSATECRVSSRMECRSQNLGTVILYSRFLLLISIGPRSTEADLLALKRGFRPVCAVIVRRSERGHIAVQAWCSNAVGTPHTRAFHEQLPKYGPTLLISGSLSKTAREVGVSWSGYRMYVTCEAPMGRRCWCHLSMSSPLSLSPEVFLDVIRCR